MYKLLQHCTHYGMCVKIRGQCFGVRSVLPYGDLGIGLRWPSLEASAFIPCQPSHVFLRNGAGEAAELVK